MSAEDDATLKTLALAAGVVVIAAEIIDRLAARSFPKLETPRYDALTLWLVVVILAAAAFL